jgi:hypothetical protein
MIDLIDSTDSTDLNAIAADAIVTEIFAGTVMISIADPADADHAAGRSLDCSLAFLDFSDRFLFTLPL